MFSVNCFEFCIYSFTIVFIPFGMLASNVSINQNIIGLLGSNDTHLTCSFIQSKEVRLLSIEITAKNRTEGFDDKKPIAIFKPGKAAKLHSSGEYLSSRVTLTNITNTSTNVTLKFRKLKCIDEKDYICKYYVIDMDGAVSTARSETTRILVKAPPSKPDIISSFIVSSNKKETQNTSSSNGLHGTNKTSVSFEQSQPYVSEWWTVMFTCTGNIGKPPGKLIWQMISPKINMSVTYSDESTEIEEIPEICSFRGTSNLTIKITPEDLKAKIRCFEESQADVQGMNVETEPFDVLLDKLQIVTESNSAEMSTVHAAYIIPVSFAVVIVAICFIVRKHKCKREKKNIQSEVSDHQEDVSEDNQYEEIESISCWDVNMINERIETSNKPIIEGEIVLENIHISTGSTSSGSDITLIPSYVNTKIVNTNEHLEMSVNTETVSNYPNELGNGNMEIGDTFVDNNSESGTLPVHQYVNMIIPRVPNIYQDLNHTTADTHKYECLKIEGNKTYTE